MIGFQYFSGALANNDAGSHGVTCRHTRHNGTISNTQIFDPVDLAVGVYNRHGITSHLGSTRLMPVGNHSIPDEAFSLSPFQVTRHHPPLLEPTNPPRPSSP